MSFEGDFKGLRLKLENSNNISQDLAALDTELRALLVDTGDVALGVHGFCGNGGLVAIKVEQTATGIVSEDTQSGDNVGAFDLVNQTLTYNGADGTVIPDIPLEDTINDWTMILTESIIVELETDNLQGCVTATLFDAAGNQLRECIIIDRDYNITENPDGSVNNLGALLTNIANQSKSHTKGLRRLDTLKQAMSDFARQSRINDTRRATRKGHVVDHISGN
jgi:hypothetical protein